MDASMAGMVCGICSLLRFDVMACEGHDDVALIGSASCVVLCSCDIGCAAVVMMMMTRLQVSRDHVGATRIASDTCLNFKLTCSCTSCCIVGG